MPPAMRSVMSGELVAAGSASLTQHRVSSLQGVVDSTLSSVNDIVPTLLDLTGAAAGAADVLIDFDSTRW